MIDARKVYTCNLGAGRIRLPPNKRPGIDSRAFTRGKRPPNKLKLPLLSVRTTEESQWHGTGQDSTCMIYLRIHYVISRPIVVIALKSKV